MRQKLTSSALSRVSGIGHRDNATPAKRLLSGVRLGVDAQSATGLLRQGRRVDIAIADGVIQSITAVASRRAGDPTAAPGRLDGRDLIVFPGFVNAHVHSNEMFEQGAYDRAALEEWLVLSYPPLLGEQPSPRLDYVRTMMMAMQSLRSGVCALHDDFLNPGGDPERLAAVFQAYEDIGIRAAVACTLGDRPYLDGLPEGRTLCPPGLAAQLDRLPIRPLKQQVRFFENEYARVRRARDPRLSLTLGPRGPQRCTEGLMRTVGELARACNIQINMHVLESRTQWQTAQQQYAQSYVEVLERNGLLCPQLTMNHAIWLTREDIARMGASGVSTTHNPMSNFKLSSGVSPVRQLLAAGVNVALGSDGPATGDSSDFMQTIRFAALIHKLEPERGLPPPSAEAVVQMASLAGARSMGTGGSCGELRPGAQADLTLLDANNAGLVPLNHAARQLAYSVGSDAVHTVLVAGDPVFQAGRFTRIDEAAMAAEIREEAERFRRTVLVARRGAQPAMLAFIRKVVVNAQRRAAKTGTVNRPLAG